MGLAMKISALASASLGGWYAGQHFERSQHLNDDKDSGTSLFDNWKIKQKPGLPIFGTVSAASPIVPTDNSDMGSKFSTTASRVGEVSIVYLSITLKKF